jgi:hypothetical protein
MALTFATRSRLMRWPVPERKWGSSSIKSFPLPCLFYFTVTVTWVL